MGCKCSSSRNNGYQCDRGIIYDRGTKQRVPLLFTSELEQWVINQIDAARLTMRNARFVRAISPRSIERGPIKALYAEEWRGAD